MERQQQGRAKRLLLDAAELEDGWLMASDREDMHGQLAALFAGEAFDDLLAARIPIFLCKVLTGPDRQRMDVEQAEQAGLLLTDGDAVPPIRRLRGIRLDVLRELALWCDAPGLVKMIDGDFQSLPTDAATTAQVITVDPRKKVSDDRVREAHANHGDNLTKLAKVLGIDRKAVGKRLVSLGLREPKKPDRKVESQSWFPRT